MAKVLITIPDSFLSKVDGFAQSENRNRSELIREALKTYIKRSSVSKTGRASEDAEKLESLIG